MTREEAIKIIRRYECNSEHYEACEMAIKALKQELCDDTISRQAAIDVLCKMLHDCFGADDEELDAVTTTLNELSSVKPQYTDAEIQKMQELEQAEIEKAYELGKAELPETGRWEIKLNCGVAFCPECGFECDFELRIDGEKYCPNCGARIP